MPQVQRVGQQADPDHRGQAQQPRTPAWPLRPRPDQRGGAQHRQQGRPSREHGGFVKGEHRDQHRHEASEAHRLIQPRPHRLLRCRHHSEHGAAQQLPGASRQGEEGEIRLAFDVGDVQPERYQQHREQHPAPMPDMAHQQHHQQREEDVVLLFYRQRPGVQQRFQIGSRLEVAILAHEQNVGNEQRLVAHRPAQLGKILGREQQPTQGQRDEHHHTQGRNDAPCTPRPEVDKAEPLRADLAEQNAGDQEAGNDKEHIHADETATECAEAEVKEYNRNDGQGPQTVDVTAITKCVH
ncbi:hypothetical protein D3C73_935670 [compost metagenome]